MTSRVLITGGAGFVGRYLVTELKKSKFEIAVLGKGDVEQAGVAPYGVDVRDEENVYAAVRDFEPAYICHLAAISSVGESWRAPRVTYDVNVFGTMNVIEAAMRLPVHPRVLNISTAQVYAPSECPLREDSPVAPRNPYAASKAMAELLSVQYRQWAGGGVITARSFNHAGPGQSPQYVLSSIAKQLVEIEVGMQEPTLAVGNTHVKRDFTDVRDVVRAYRLLLTEGEPNETYNVCSGRARSIKEIIEDFAGIADVKVKVESSANKRRSEDSDTLCGNADKIRNATGWEPTVSWQTTLQDLLDYWRDRTPREQEVRQIVC